MEEVKNARNISHNSKLGFQIVESGVIAPVTIQGNDNVYKEVTLDNTYDISKYFIITTAVAFTDVAYITTTVHWGAKGQDARNLTTTNKILVYITNTYQHSAQIAGAYWFIVER